MSNRDIVLVAALVVGAVLYMKRAKASPTTTVPKGGQVQTNNVQDQRWNAVIGGAWKFLKDAQNKDGSPAFLMKNWMGQTVTSDGKPVGEQLGDLFPYAYGDGMTDSVSYGDTPDLINGLFPTLSGEWWQ
ncbi:hypothetical protein JAB8_05910 [Janthinobacterium sp. HH106]|uniref:hypothetical protein n=1 Tax=Janthinobacterium sp. HH106 TaxID=1537278 RepID=UPI00087534A5|nr:hypothetical protein [Janthinobacterium sp. HH106]OEZ93475.1 hypothetical protein JAB8_05910 [Janthinobacterium sp. HH106]